MRIWAMTLIPSNIISSALLASAYLLLAFAFWPIARIGYRSTWGKMCVPFVGIVFLLLPISQELWISWNFDQLCKGAGTFIHKSVTVDGYYDGTRTTHAGPPTPQAIAAYEKSGYRFFEMKGREKFVRIEKIGAQWVARVLEHPTARYHFEKRYAHLDVSHGVRKFEWVVLDQSTGEELARETAFARDQNWYFIGLDRPRIFCEVHGKYGGNLLRTIPGAVLIPRG